MTITQTRKGFELKFKWNPDIIAEVKKIRGSYYNKDLKIWTIPLYREAAKDQIKKKFGFQEEGQFELLHTVNFSDIPPMPELDVEIPLLKMKPFPFQNNGIAYNRIHRKTIIGDQPGLGKTLQAIATVLSFGLNDKGMLNAGPVLVICPSSLKMNWQQEWMKVGGRRAMILSDRIKNTWMQYYKVGMCDVFIVNYESLKKFFVEPGWKKPEGEFKLQSIVFRDCIDLFKTVIVDESHRCKDGNTQQAKFVMGITHGKENVFALTGTPVVNNPVDLISQLYIIDRLRDVVSHLKRPVDSHNVLQDFSGYKRFLKRYCDGGRKAINMEELHVRLRMHCFYRREKSEVLKDLPSKIRQVIMTEISNRAEYLHAENDFVDYLERVKNCTDEQVQTKLRGEMMVKIGILKNISARGKLHQVKEFVDDIVESGEKIILFVYLKEIVHKLKEIYPHAVTITGEDDNDDRNAAVNAFQLCKQCGVKLDNHNGLDHEHVPSNTNIAIINYKSGGVGLTLTAASRVAFVEFPWTFADCEQCEDRAHRIGQVDSVMCSYFLGDETIDQYCYDLIQKKKNISQTITGAADDVEENIVDQLLTLFKRK